MSTTPLEDAWRADRDSMVRAVYMTCGDRDLALDVVDEAFVTVASRLRHIPIENLRGYLWRTAFNGSARSRQKQRRRLEAADLAWRFSSSASTGPEELVDPDLVASLARLDEPTRVVLVLRFYGDFTVPQIADHQGLALGTVKSMIHRGLAAMRRDLSPSGRAEAT